MVFGTSTHNVELIVIYTSYCYGLKEEEEQLEV